MNKGRIISINISKEKRTSKKPIKRAYLRKSWGVLGDAHACKGKRQVSLLAIENIKYFSEHFPNLNITPGIFAENITTQGLNFEDLTLGDKLRLGRRAELKITQFGKRCHTSCMIKKKVGVCIMPKKGVFAEVTKSGEIKINDSIKIE